MDYKAKFDNDILVLNKPYTKWLEEFYGYFGEPCQKLKLVSEVLELRKELLRACQIINRIEQLKLMQGKEKESCLYEYMEDLEKVMEAIHFEVADVVALTMQIKKVDYSEAYKTTINSEWRMIKVINKHKESVNKNYVFSILLEKIEYMAKNMRNYNKETGIHKEKLFQCF